jgi:hypothetical protein
MARKVKQTRAAPPLRLKLAAVALNLDGDDPVIIEWLRDVEAAETRTEVTIEWPETATARSFDDAKAACEFTFDFVLNLGASPKEMQAHNAWFGTNNSAESRQQSMAEYDERVFRHWDRIRGRVGGAATAETASEFETSPRGIQRALLRHQNRPASNKQLELEQEQMLQRLYQRLKSQQAQAEV